MVLVLCFFKHRLFNDLYIHVEMLVGCGNQSLAFSVYRGGEFGMIEPEHLNLTDEACDFMTLPTGPLEDDMIMRTCDACCQSHIKYNLRDSILSVVAPFMCGTDTDLFHSPTLHAPQAVVLILRECLDPDNPVLKAMQGFNSRTFTSRQLGQRLCGIGTYVLQSSVARLMSNQAAVAGGAGSRQRARVEQTV